MKFRPLYDRVLVKRVTTESKSAGGLFIQIGRAHV